MPLPIISNARHFTLSVAQLVGKNVCCWGSCWVSCWIVAWLTLLFVGQLLAGNAPVNGTTLDPLNQRYVNLEGDQPGSNSKNVRPLKRCVSDKRTRLVWEVKTNDDGLQDANQSYSWYEPDAQANGGSPGSRRRGQCKLANCDTQSYIAEINKLRLCGRADWRLPTREELRSLVEYDVAYPGPTIDQLAFPNTISQFYWSSTANANDNETAWGIGFSFGYDYAYFKSDHGYIRLVSGPDK